MPLNNTPSLARISARLLGRRALAGPRSQLEVRLRPSRLSSSFRLREEFTSSQITAGPGAPDSGHITSCSMRPARATSGAVLCGLSNSLSVGREPQGCDHQGLGGLKACQAHRPGSEGSCTACRGGRGFATSHLCLRWSPIRSPNCRDLSPPTTQSRIF